MKDLQREEKAASEILGTILLIGVAVSVAGVAAFAIPSQHEAERPVLRLEVSARVNATHLTILHTGGAQLDLAQLRLLVEVGGISVIDRPAGMHAGTWSLGETLKIPLAQPLPPGRAEISLVHAQRGQTLATATIIVPSPPAPSAFAGFTTLATLDGATTPLSVAPASYVLAQATVTHPEGRRYIRHVHADLSNVGGPVWVMLQDDGTRGDARAGDGTWSALLPIPVGASPGSHLIRISAMDLDGAMATHTLTLNVT